MESLRHLFRRVRLVGAYKAFTRARFLAGSDESLWAETSAIYINYQLLCGLHKENNRGNTRLDCIISYRIPWNFYNTISVSVACVYMLQLPLLWQEGVPALSVPMEGHAYSIFWKGHFVYEFFRPLFCVARRKENPLPVYLYLHMCFWVCIFVRMWILIKLLLRDVFFFLFQGVPMGSLVLNALVSSVYCIVQLAYW